MRLELGLGLGEFANRGPTPPVYDLVNFEADVAAFQFACQRAVVRDTGTPANDHDGDCSILTVTRATGEGHFNEYGLFVWDATNDTLRFDHDPATVSASTTSVTIGTATKAFITDGAYTFVAGQTVQATDNASASNFIRGKVVAYDSTSFRLSIIPEVTGGSGTKADWTIIRCLGILAEAQQTNLLTYSEDRDQWTVTGLTNPADGTLANDIDGLQFDDSDAQFFAVYDVSNTAFVTNFTAYGSASSSVPARQTHTFTTPSGCTSIRVYSCQVDGSNFSYQTVTVAASTQYTFSFYHEYDGSKYKVGGLQVVAGAYVGSYIPTVASQVTRNADLPGIALTDIPYAAPFTIVGKASPSGDDASTARNLFTLYEDGSNYITLRNGTAGSSGLQVLARTDASNAIVITDNGGIAAADFWFAAAFGTDDGQLVTDGESQGTDTSGDLADGLTNLYFGNTGASGFGTAWNGHIEELALIPRRLNAAQMIARTS